MANARREQSRATGNGQSTSEYSQSPEHTELGELEGLEPEVASNSASDVAKDSASRWALILFQEGRPDDPMSYLSSTLVTSVRHDLRDAGLSTDKRDSTEIDVWLETGGGDAHAAYKLVLLLRAHAARMRVVVPDRAKSAGTLVVLGADEIYMAPAAELGPLDAQIHHEAAGIGISALDMAKSIDYLALQALTVGLTGASRLVEATGISRQQSIEAVLNFAANFISPVVCKLDPSVIHKSKNQLRVAQEYASRLLVSRSVHTQYEPDIASLLVEDYPHHGFVISRKEAKGDLGLPVEHTEDYPYWDELEEAYEPFEADGSPMVELLPLGEGRQSSEEEEAQPASLPV